MYSDYTLGLALFDFLPVIFSAIGLCYLACWLGGKASLANNAGISLDRKPLWELPADNIMKKASLANMAWLGALLVALGGLSKASWKLIVVTADIDIQILDNALFVFLGAGYSLLVVSLLSALLKTGQWSWFVAGVLVIGFWIVSHYLSLSAVESRNWSRVLLFQTVVMNTILLLTLTGMALRNGLLVGALLLLLNLAAAFLLARLANIPEQTLSLQWTEELINAAAQGAFLIAIIMLTQRVVSPAADSRNEDQVER